MQRYGHHIISRCDPGADSDNHEHVKNFQDEIHTVGDALSPAAAAEAVLEDLARSLQEPSQINIEGRR